MSKKRTRRRFSVSGVRVFAGGDVVRGPSLVVHAVRDGRKAAEAIHAVLRPESWNPNHEKTHSLTGFNIEIQGLSPVPKIQSLTPEM